MMFYESTRGGISGITSSMAVQNGIAEDGGLFVPSKDIFFSLKTIDNLREQTYRQRAYGILKHFFDDFSKEELHECIDKAYNEERFDHNDIVRLKSLNENVNVLELWHGPTLAFKDMALQILPHLLVKSTKKNNESKDIVILVATSGDTGKAALEGFKDVKGTRVIVFYPENGVSDIQKMQMITQQGSNVDVIAVEGNFDDAQTGVKNIFADKELAKKMDKKGFKFSSANSINWGRLAPQIVYYFSAYADMLNNGTLQIGEAINIVVPTGNFGNILAAYYAMNIGLPINRLICASNQNNVLTDFVKTGVYNKNRKFEKTISPSMDILVSSNLERLLYHMSNRNAVEVKNMMESLNSEGCYRVNKSLAKKIRQLIWADYSSDKDTMKTIKSVYKEYGYLIDTHTAVAIDVYDKYVIKTGDVTKTIIASTASPFKFNKSVATALFGEQAIEGRSEYNLLGDVSYATGVNVPATLADMDKLPKLHDKKCKVGEMKETIKQLIGL